MVTEVDLERVRWEVEVEDGQRETEELWEVLAVGVVDWGDTVHRQRRRKHQYFMNRSKIKEC